MTTQGRSRNKKHFMNNVIECCADSFSDLISCCIDDQIVVNAKLTANTAITWNIVDKFGHQYSGESTTDDNGSFIIPVTDLPDGLLTRYAGFFRLSVTDVGDPCKPVPMLLSKYYDAIDFSVQRSNTGKKNLGCGDPFASAPGFQNIRNIDKPFSNNQGTGFDLVVAASVAAPLGKASGFNLTVSETIVLPNGTILCTGSFTEFNDSVANRIIRLNADGSLDTSPFNKLLGSGFDDEITPGGAIMQPDGKFVIGGKFRAFNDDPVNRLVRINANGTIDSAFVAATNGGANETVQCVAVQQDGKILVGGSFPEFGGMAVSRIVRLNPDGSNDQPFVAANYGGTNGVIYSIFVDDDGKIYVGGYFTSMSSNPGAKYFCRLNSDGSLDTSFSAMLGTGFNNAVAVIRKQADGKFLIGGFFDSLNGDGTVKYFTRLNSDFTIDMPFNNAMGAGANNVVITTKEQTDGKILIGGAFTEFNNEQHANKIVRINADGTLDTSFTDASGAGANGSIYDVNIQGDGKILVAGDFSDWDHNVNEKYLIRLHENGIPQ